MCSNRGRNTLVAIETYYFGAAGGSDLGFDSNTRICRVLTLSLPQERGKGQWLHVREEGGCIYLVLSPVA